jgi:hypothetical protein
VELAPNQQSQQRRVALALGGFGLESAEALADRHGISHEILVQCAVEHHLERIVQRRPGAGPPPFERQPVQGGLEVDVALPAETWEKLELESVLEGVPLEQLIEHAVLSLMADLDSGRVAVRVAARLA